MRNVLIISLCVLTTLWSFGQDMKLSGTVVDSKNQSLPGVSVQVKGTGKGAVTDADGKFEIQAKGEDANKKLVVSFIGYKSQEFDINSTTVFKVILEEDQTNLEEVVVVGYGSVKKSDLTGAVASVKTEDLKTMATSGIVGAMQGRVAGVNITSTSGEPGEGMQVRIRGIGTINNSEPLYVIDGFIGGDMGALQPRDIESMEILKDASATAIYGSRGANGVILIKTKSGKKDRFSIDFDAYSGYSEITKKIDVCNAYQWALIKEKRDGKLDDILSLVKANKSKGTNWQDEIFRTAIRKNYNIGISGGSDKHIYDISAGYSKNEGIVKETYDEKWSAKANNEYVLSKNIKFGLNLSFYNYERTIDRNDLYNGSITKSIVSDPITSAWDSNKNDFSAMLYSGQANPARTVSEDAGRKNIQKNYTANTYLQIDDIYFKGLSFRTQGGINIQNQKYKEFLPAYNAKADDNRLESILFERRQENHDWMWTNYVTYNAKIGKNSVNLMGGFELQQNETDYIGVAVYNLPNDENLKYIDAHKDASQWTASGTATDRTIASAFLRANYSFDNKYMFTATYRADGSSKFTGDNQWGYFPSFSFGWNAHEESFVKQFDFLSQLKLRAGWGQVGNEGSVNNYQYVTTVYNGYNYAFGYESATGSAIENLSNKELKWEVNEQTNLAIDFGFLKSKLTGSIEYYIRKTSDMLIAVPVPFYSGVQPITKNAGAMENRGLEVSLNYQDELPFGLKYSIGANISTVKNEVTDLKGTLIDGGRIDKVGYTTRTIEGQEIAYFNGLKTEGIFHSQAEVDSYTKDGTKIQPDAKAGDVKFVDNNGDGKINDNDRVKLGSAIPDFTYGINVSLEYKGIDMKMTMQGSQGNELVNSLYTYTHSSDLVGGVYNVSTDMLNSFSFNPNSNIPRITSEANDNSKFSDLYVEDASYVRIKNLQIGYTLPSDLTKKILVQNLRIYLSADNLYTWTNYSGYDPEVYGMAGYSASNTFSGNYSGKGNYSAINAGIDQGSYPVARTFSIGVNVKF